MMMDLKLWDKKLTLYKLHEDKKWFSLANVELEAICLEDS